MAEDESTKESKKILERVAQESESVGASSMRRVADRVRGHMGAEDADQNNWSELWGTRIGRGLGFIALFVLIVYLMQTYFL